MNEGSDQGGLIRSVALAGRSIAPLRHIGMSHHLVVI
jgi:hypothetical protein